MPRSPAKPRTSGTSGTRRFHERAGRRGEAWAALFLQLKRYRILARRVKTPVGEIDLIARRGDLVVFVEVKARASRAAGLEAIPLRGWKRIATAAGLFMAAHPEYAAFGWRYDMIVVAPGVAPQHEADAWRPDW